MGHHLVLYDGVCGLCNGLVQFLVPRDRALSFVYAPLQSATGRGWLIRYGLEPDALSTFVVVTDFRSDHPGALTKSDAALFVIGQLPAPWRWLRSLAVLPRAWRDWAYDVVARYRYRVFGRQDTCPLPDPGILSRFIDS